MIQVTAASVDGSLGKRTASCARSLIDLELAHCIASDAHGPASGRREVGCMSGCWGRRAGAVVDGGGSRGIARQSADADSTGEDPSTYAAVASALVAAFTCDGRRSRENAAVGRNRVANRVDVA